MRSKPSSGTTLDTPAPALPVAGPGPLRPLPDEESFPAALARSAVEIFVLRGEVLEVADGPAATLLLGPAACFVCLKTLAGKLRGCIGTVEPARRTLSAEIVHNAIRAATRDPRFPPVSADELPLLRYTVDVLERPEPATLEDLNPSEFGVIVEDNTGRRRGLLLPAIEGVERVCDQILIATRKAGIASGEPHKLYRFRVRRFREAAGAGTFQPKEGLSDA
jgi:AmmeMemoRadiSam system protein A